MEINILTILKKNIDKIAISSIILIAFGIINKIKRHYKKRKLNEIKLKILKERNLGFGFLLGEDIKKQVYGDYQPLINFINYDLNEYQDFLYYGIDELYALKDYHSLTIENNTSEFKAGKIDPTSFLNFYCVGLRFLAVPLNLVADINFNRVKEAFKLADNIYKEYSIGASFDRVPPLLGIPITVKDHINVQGYRSTLGYINENNIAKEDSLIVKVLRHKGAIILAKSNVAQGLMSLESKNNLWGNARNPHNPRKTAGGSSGGEGGLIAARCSYAGIGTDFGGSIRVPCSFNGIYGFKPTSIRISIKGHMASDYSINEGYHHIIRPSWGPMASNAENVIFLMKQLFGEFNEDPFVLNNSKFDEEIFNKQINPETIKIAYLLDYDFCETAPDIKNSLTNLFGKLKEKGYTNIKELDVKLVKIIENILSTLSDVLSNLNELDLIKKGLDGEPLCDFYDDWVSLKNKSTFVKKLMGFYYKMTGESRYSMIYSNSKNLTKDEFNEKVNLLNKLKSEFYKEYINNNYNCLIMPVMPFPAFDVGKSKIANYFNHFCIILNVLDMPAAALPLATVPIMPTPYVTKYNDSFATEIKEIISGSSKLPIGYQIATLPNEDELCLKFMKEFDIINSY